jgi:hypothetical protein
MSNEDFDEFDSLMGENSLLANIQYNGKSGFRKECAC